MDCPREVVDRLVKIRSEMAPDKKKQQVPQKPTAHTIEEESTPHPLHERPVVVMRSDGPTVCPFTRPEEGTTGIVADEQGCRTNFAASDKEGMRKQSTTSPLSP